MKIVERHKKTDFGDVWYVNAIDGTYRFAVYRYDDDDDTIYLSNVFVKEDSRKQGYGNEILSSTEEYANRLGASVICLKVLIGSDVHRWYKRHGYEDLEKDEEERGYMWMKKDLKKVNESVWADIYKRSNGTKERKEDSIDTYGSNEMLKYIYNHYIILNNLSQPRVRSNVLYVPVVLQKNSTQMSTMHSLFYDYDVDVVYVSKDSFNNVFKNFKDDFKTEIFEDNYISISPKDGSSVKNSFLIKLIDLIIGDMDPMDRVFQPLLRKREMNESIWSDIHKRSNGEQVRKEDDVNILDLEEFYAYVKNHYKTKVEYIDLDAMGGGNGDVLGVDITDNIILFYKPKRGHILLSWSKVKIPMPFFDELADRFKIENPNAMRRIITENDGSCTNKTFIDVIDFFLDHKESLINESVWSDIHKRSNGEQVRKEDDYLIDEKELDRSSEICISTYVIQSVYYDKYDGTPETFYECIKNWDRNICSRGQLYDTRNREYVDPSKIIPSYIKKNWETGKSYKSYINKSVSDVENEIRKTGFVKKPGESISDTLSKWFDENSDLIAEEYDESIEEYTLTYYREGGSRFTEIGVDEWWDDLDYIDQIKIYQEHMEKTNESVWSDIHKRSNGDAARKEDVILTDEELKQLDQYISDYGNEVVLGWLRGTDACNLDEFCDYLKNDRHIDDRIIGYVKYNWDKSICDDVEASIEQSQDEYNDDMNESVWSDIHKRSNGEQVRKEDEMNGYEYDFLNDCLFEFSSRVVWDGEKASREKLSNCIRQQSKGYQDINVERVIKYVENHWDDVSKELDTLIEQEEKDKEAGMNESVWADIHKRSNGAQLRKEDELTSDDYTILKEVLIMFGREVRFAIHNNINYKNFKYKNTLEDCVKFINVLIDSDFRGVDLFKLKKYVETNWEKDPIIQKIIQWTIDGKRSKEINQEIRNEIKNSTWDLNECDGVPGGITPADVGGMGEITFPGVDGTPGSGDIPMPTGHVYHQVAPFGLFINVKKGKKKKKKFRKEDEPCVHSENPPIYSHVDDFRDYVDRVYNQIDRKK